MANTPKPLRKGWAVRKGKAEKELKKIIQQTKQAHRRLPNHNKTNTPLKTELSPYVQKIHKQKIEIRAKKAKAVILKLLKKREKEKQRITADLKNQFKMENFRTIYIENKLTKCKFKIPSWEANKYYKKGFIRSNKLAYLEQIKKDKFSYFEKKERKAIALNKLEKITQEVTDKIYKGKDENKKPIYEEVKRIIEIYGLPIKKVTTRQHSTHNPFNGKNRKERRTIEYGNSRTPGNRFLKRQIIHIIPKKVEEKIITWYEPQYEYIKETFNFYEKINNSDPLGKRTHPKIKTDIIIGTTEIIKKIFKGLEEKTKTITRTIPSYYKSFLTMTIPSKKGIQIHKYKQEVEAFIKAQKDEKLQAEKIAKSEKSKNRQTSKEKKDSNDPKSLDKSSKGQTTKRSKRSTKT